MNWCYVCPENPTKKARSKRDLKSAGREREKIKHLSLASSQKEIIIHGKEVGLKEKKTLCWEYIQTNNIKEGSKRATRNVLPNSKLKHKQTTRRSNRRKREKIWEDDKGLALKNRENILKR